MISNPKETANLAFGRLAFMEKPKCAIHIEWEDIADTFSELLQEILGRPDIQADSAREEYYYWKITLGTALTQTELELLFELAGASDRDREESNCEDGFPIIELCEGLCKKLMGKLLPFDLVSTHADDEGVWFIGDQPDSNEINYDERNEDHA